VYEKDWLLETTEPIIEDKSLDITLENIIRPYILKANTIPSLSHFFAFHADNAVRKFYDQGISITYTRYGIGISSGLEYTIKKNHISKNSLFFENCKETDSLANDYLSTKIKYTNSINLVYANKVNNSELLWLYFFNKYLKQYSSQVALMPRGNRFLSLSPIGTNGFCQHNHLKVSVIMCAHNAESTLEAAAESILRQTHNNMELLIVNDKSDDKTGLIAEGLRDRDPRIKVIHNNQNYGAYVSRNIALKQIDGDYFTCHDADDIAMPTRLERQLGHLLKEGSTSNICLMLRVSPEGQVTRKTAPNSNSPDGLSKVCHISGFHDASFFRDNFGFWDSVRYGADSELLGRIKTHSSAKLTTLPSVEYLALDSEASATRDATVGLFSEKGQKIRELYKNSWTSWQRSAQSLYLGHPQASRVFFAPSEFLVGGFDYEG
jgi:hypothetical protein